MKRERMSTAAWTVPASAWWRRAKSWWGFMARLGRSGPRRLRLCESLPLGDRRFVAVLEFDGSRFLLGGTPSSLVLLARLADQENSLSRLADGRAPKAAQGDTA